MKKILLSEAFFVALLVCWAGVFAQTPFSAVNSAKQDCAINSNVYNIVMTRGIYPNAALSYQDNVSNAVTPRFMLNYNASSVQTFDLPDKVHVNDYEQVDGQNMVVFCGYILVYNGSITHNEGILGWFEPFNPGNYYIMQFPNVEVFEHVAGYTNNSLMHLVATGLHNAGGWVEDIVYVGGLPNIPGSYLYTHYTMAHGQVLAEIVKTKEYLVFVGGGNGICLRREKYGNMGLGNELMNYHVFPTPGVDMVSTPLATFLGNTLDRRHHMVAVGAPFIDAASLDYGSHYYTFDISSMTMTNAQKFKLAGKESPFGMSYIEDARGLSVLHREIPNTGTWATPVIFLDPYPTVPYTADYFIDPESDFVSIDNLNHSLTGLRHLLMGVGIQGGFRWTLRSEQCGHNTFLPCNVIGNIDVETIHVTSANSYSDGVKATGSVDMTIETVQVNSVAPDSLKCVN